MHNLPTKYTDQQNKRSLNGSELPMFAQRLYC